VKATSSELLATLKESKLVLDWRKRQQTRAGVLVTIEELLDHGLPRVYTPALLEQKAMAVYEHVYDTYYGAGCNVYATGINFIFDSLVEEQMKILRYVAIRFTCFSTGFAIRAIFLT
jgi:hypothetical protein